MDNVQEYKRNFSLLDAYGFLRQKNLADAAEQIQISRDKFKSYTSTLRRAKIVKVVTDNGLMNEFIEKCWPSGKTSKGQKRIKFWLELYTRFKDSESEEEFEDQEAEEIESEEGKSPEERQFAYERDLQNYLANNLNKIEPGLKLYQNEDDTGIEFSIDDDGRRVDILALDKSGTPVVVELKVSRGHERVIGQVLYYAARIKRLLNKDHVRIIIVASSISDELRLASETLGNIDLYEYRISMDLQRI